MKMIVNFTIEEWMDTARSHLNQKIREIKTKKMKNALKDHTKKSRKNKLIQKLESPQGYVIKAHHISDCELFNIVIIRINLCL